jgi:hypothetical protein
LVGSKPTTALSRILQSITVLLTVLLTSASAQVAAKNPRLNVDDQLKKLDQQCVEAERKGDTTFLDQLFADEYEFVNIRGDILPKARTLALIKSAKREIFELLQPAEIEVHVYGNLAVINDKTTMRSESSDAVKIDSLVYFTRIFVKKSGRWRMVHEQGTVAKAPPPAG